MAAPRRLLVTGATGKQGGALIAALLAKPSQPFEIYAVTRNKASGNAKKLAQQSGVKLVEGDLDNADAILAQVPKPVWGVFSVPMLDKGYVKEEAKGKALTAAAVDAGVSHIIFTSNDRGGQEKSNGNPTNVPHFASKFRIEQDIEAKSASSDGRLSYTFLRPVAFFENLSDNFFGRGFVAMWRLDGLDRPLQHIATSDIGRIAAEAFLNADSPEYKNQAISLAGDSLTPNEAARIFREETGKKLPVTYSWVGGAIRWMVADLHHMFAWFRSDGFGVDVPALRKRYPFLKDFRSWLREDSAWKKA
jgi:uncharacterized protein YbjT (DUF2867 family)